jgi:F1F0 ATPase subunit 2
MELIIFLVIFFLAGLVLGLFYFGMLWLTVRNLTDAQYPALFAVGSFFGRISVLLLAFYLIADLGRWEFIPATVIGIITARFLTIKRWGPSKPRVIKTTRR